MRGKLFITIEKVQKALKKITVVEGQKTGENQ